MGTIEVDPAQDSQIADSPRWPLKLALTLVAVFYVFALPLIFAQVNKDRAAFDAVQYHIKAITQFAAELPDPDLSNYRSATTPLYHLLLSVVGRVVSTDPVVLQLAGTLFTAGLLTVLVTACCRRTTGWSGFCRCLPFACSPYVFGAGVWTLPDNAAWLGVLLVLLIGLRPRVSWRSMGAGAIVILLLVLTRQIHLWAAAVLWAAAWMGSLNTPDSRDLFGHLASRVPRTLLVMLATLPAFGAVYYFYDLWGGLVVPRYQGMYTGWSPATPAFVLSLLGVFGTFFAADMAPRLLMAWRAHRSTLALAALIGLALSLAPATNYSTDDGRFSGLWNLSRVVEVGRTGPLIVLLSVVGAVYVAAMILSLRFRERWVVLAAVAGFTAAQTASPMLWQRYNEPFVLMLLTVLLSKPIHRPHWDDNPAGPSTGPVITPSLLPALVPAGRVLGPTLLAILLAAWTFVKISGGAQVQPRDDDPVIERSQVQPMGDPGVWSPLLGPVAGWHGPAITVSWAHAAG